MLITDKILIVCFVVIFILLLPPFSKGNILILFLLPFAWIIAIISMILHRKSVKYLVLMLPILAFLTFNALFYLTIFYYGTRVIFGGDSKIWIEGSQKTYRRFFGVEKIGKEEYGQPVIYALINNHIGNFIDVFGLDLIDESSKIMMVDLPIISRVVPKDHKILLPWGKSSNYDYIVDECRKCVKEEKRSIIAFPEGKYSIQKIENISWKGLTKFQSGIFNFAFENNVPIVPVITESYRSFHYILTPGKFRIHYLPIIKIEEVKSADELKDLCRTRMLEKLEKI